MKLEIVRTNGNIPKSLPGEDYISGFVAYVTELPEGFSASDRIKLLSSIDSVEQLGIKADSETWEHKVLHYHLSEIFRINPGVALYLGLFAKPSDSSSYTFTEVKQIQNFAGGKIRQVAVYAGDVSLEGEQITALQGIATTLESQDKPLSILYAPKVTSVTELSKELAGTGKKNVSVVIAQAGSGKAADLFADKANASKTTVSAIGIVLGLLSLSSVQQSIAWVKNFPTGVDVPAFGDGTLLHSLDEAIVIALDAARYLYFVTYSGLTGSYMNDSHTMDEATSDYAMIENVRTMDKAVRGIRTYLLPELGSNVYVDEKTGKLQSYTVKHLQDVANKALEDMQKAGELSGYAVEIDSEQDILSTSTVELVLKPVGVGVIRKMRVKIGFAKSI